MPDATSLAEFTAAAGTLTLDQRKALVEQALVLIEQNYVHLPLKVAMHAVNPVQRLRVLRARLQRQTEETMGPEWLFHRELSSTFHSVRDLHTNYLLPEPFTGKVAYLPFRIEKCFGAQGTAHYVVTKLIAGYSAPTFGPGVEVTHVNGTPVDRAVALNGEQFAGSNPAANLARGLDSLTLRPLKLQLPPAEDWATVTYIGLDGEVRELREQWKVVGIPPAPGEPADALTVAIDLDSEEKSRARVRLYRPDVAELAATLDEPVAVGAEDIPTTMPTVFRARIVDTAHGTFGHLRIFTFHVKNEDAFRREFARLAAVLPQDGLVVDIRGNGGGNILASELTLQTLTPQRVQPEPVQLVATPLNLRLCRRHASLAPWVDSLEQAGETGATFSAAHPITPPARANDTGQTYHGPVVLITDALCYSASDIFAAGFADHSAGMILGVDGNTGAGGANVVHHSDLRALLPDAPYEPLPNGADMRVAWRRTLRVGQQAGTPLEDLGVQPDRVHQLTRDDLLNDNVDLLDEAGKLLAGQVVRKLVAAIALVGSALTVGLDTGNIDRADLYLDGRPVKSLRLTGTPVTTTVSDVVAGQTLRIEGFAGDALVAARRFTT